MRPEVGKYFQDIREACDALAAFTQGKSFQDYCSDRLLQAGVEREFITVGEALLQAHKVDALVGQTISGFRRIVGFRNVLVHGYASIDNDRLGCDSEGSAYSQPRSRCSSRKHWSAVKAIGV